MKSPPWIIKSLITLKNKTKYSKKKGIKVVKLSSHLPVKSTSFESDGHTVFFVFTRTELTNILGSFGNNIGKKFEFYTTNFLKATQQNLKDLKTCVVFLDLKTLTVVPMVTSKKTIGFWGFTGGFCILNNWNLTK